MELVDQTNLGLVDYIIVQVQILSSLCVTFILCLLISNAVITRRDVSILFNFQNNSNYFISFKHF